jgi:hypothetical protein
VGFGDHSLEYYSITLDNIINRKHVNLFQSIPRHQILNSKKLHVVTRLGENIGEDETM